MKPKPSAHKNRQLSLIKIELTSIISMTHAMVKLAHIIDWENLENNFAPLYCQGNGRPALSTRLMVGLNYLKYLHDLSDDDVLAQWIENPYWQYFCGMKFFEHALPIDSSSMTRWRKRISKEGAEDLLKETITAGLKLRVIKKSEIKNVNVDTTVQEKNIRFPTDARLYHRSLTKLVSLAKKENIELRQTYTRISKRLLIKQQRYAHSRKSSLARQCTKKLRTLVGRVIRDIERKTPNPSNKMLNLLSITKRVHSQQKTDKSKIYSLHEPMVSCIAKGKVHKKYEFGSKVSIMSTNKSNFILGVLNFLGNPYDGKTLVPALSQAESFGLEIENIFVDQGYKAHGVKHCKVHICKNQKQSSSKSLWKKIKRRAAIEPIIGHLKSEHRLDCNRLSGVFGDILNLIFSSAAFNLKKLLNWLKSQLPILFYCLFINVALLFYREKQLA